MTQEITGCDVCDACGDLHPIRECPELDAIGFFEPDARSPAELSADDLALVDEFSREYDDGRYSRLLLAA